jgi:hypothetical protein
MDMSKLTSLSASSRQIRTKELGYVGKQDLHTYDRANFRGPVRKSQKLGSDARLVELADQPLTGGRLAGSVAALKDDEGPAAANGRHASAELENRGGERFIE